jgi:hypothetical protein
VVILKVNNKHFAFLGIDSERQTPVARDMQTPNTFSVSFEHMSLPNGDCSEFVLLLNVLQKLSIFRILSTASGGNPFELSSR